MNTALPLTKENKSMVLPIVKLGGIDLKGMLLPPGLEFFFGGCIKARGGQTSFNK